MSQIVVQSIIISLSSSFLQFQLFSHSGKDVFSFSILWRNYVICLRFLLRKHGKTNYNNSLYGDCIDDYAKDGGPGAV